MTYVRLSTTSEMSRTSVSSGVMIVVVILNMKNRIGITDTLYMYRKMKNQINIRYFTREFHFISNLPNLLEDFIGTHITRTQLPFLDKSHHPLIGNMFSYTA